MSKVKISDFFDVFGTQDDVIFCKSEELDYACEYDALGSIYCRKGAPAKPGEGLMIAAAMDLKRFMAAHVDGVKVWFHTIGPLEAKNIVDQPVRFENGVGGVIRHKDHAEGMEEDKKKDAKLEDLYILTDGDEYAVEVGEEAVLEGPDVYADNLTACMALLQTMEELEEEPAADSVTFVFLNQFWSGRMGIRAAMANVKPQTCILCGTSEALEEGDMPDGEKAPVDLKLGAGPAIRFRERLHASDEATCRALIAAAEGADVKWQGEARNAEFDGGIEVMVTGSRAGQSYLGVPVKGRGTTCAKYDQSDVDACAKVLVEFVRRF